MGMNIYYEWKELQENRRMAQADLNTSIQFENATFSLGDLANLPTEGIEEVRFFKFPKGMFDWRVDSAELATLGSGTDQKVVVPFVLECTKAHVVQDPGLKPADCVGQKHQETFFISDNKGVGRVLAFLKDIGVEGRAPFAEQIAKGIGKAFAAPIQHRKDKDDKDKVYRNIEQDRIQRLA